jgi:hypothetical protein
MKHFFRLLSQRKRCIGSPLHRSACGQAEDADQLNSTKSHFVTCRRSMLDVSMQSRNGNSINLVILRTCFRLRVAPPCRAALVLSNRSPRAWVVGHFPTGAEVGYFYE